MHWLLLSAAKLMAKPWVSALTVGQADNILMDSDGTPFYWYEYPSSSDFNVFDMEPQVSNKVHKLQLDLARLVAAFIGEEINVNV
jgi:hypothetical protein